MLGRTVRPRRLDELAEVVAADGSEHDRLSFDDHRAVVFIDTQERFTADFVRAGAHLSPCHRAGQRGRDRAGVGRVRTGLVAGFAGRPPAPGHAVSLNVALRSGFARLANGHDAVESELAHVIAETAPRHEKRTVGRDLQAVRGIGIGGGGAAGLGFLEAGGKTRRRQLAVDVADDVGKIQRSRHL